MKTISTLCATSTVGIAACGLALGRPRELQHHDRFASYPSAGSVSTDGQTASSLSIEPASTSASNKKAWYRRLSGSLSSAVGYSPASSSPTSSISASKRAARHHSLTVTTTSTTTTAFLSSTGSRSHSPLTPRTPSTPRNRLVKRSHSRAASPALLAPPSPSIIPGPPLSSNSNTSTTTTTSTSTSSRPAISFARNISPLSPFRSSPSYCPATTTTFGADRQAYDPQPVQSWRVFFKAKRHRSKSSSIKRIYPNHLYQPTLVLAHVISDDPSDTSSVYSGKSIYYDSQPNTSTMPPLFATSPTLPPSPVQKVKIRRSMSLSISSKLHSPRLSSGSSHSRRHSSAPTYHWFPQDSTPYHTPFENFAASPLPRPCTSEAQHLPPIELLSVENISSIQPEPSEIPLPASPTTEQPLSLEGNEGDNILQNDSIYRAHRLSLLTNTGSERASTLIGSDAGEDDFDIGNENVFDSVRTRVNEGVTPVRVESIFDLSTSPPDMNSPLVIKKTRSIPYVDDIDNVSPTSDVFRGLTPPPPVRLEGWLASRQQDDSDDISWNSDWDVPKNSKAGNHLKVEIPHAPRRPEGSAPMYLKSVFHDTDSKSSVEDPTEWGNDGDSHNSSSFGNSPVNNRAATWRPKTSYTKGKSATTIGPKEGATMNPAHAHSRSQSLPVRSSAKKTTESWDSDFEGDGVGLGGGEVIVPLAIQERQQKLRRNLDSIKEFAALVEDLKRLMEVAKSNGARWGDDEKLWDEAEGVIALATTDSDEEEEPRGRQRDSDMSSGFSFDDFSDEEDDFKFKLKEEKRISVKSGRPSILPSDSNVFSGVTSESAYSEATIKGNKSLERLNPRHVKSFSTSSTESRTSLKKSDPTDLARQMMERMQRSTADSLLPSKNGKVQFDSKMLGPLIDQVRKIIVGLEKSLKDKQETSFSITGGVKDMKISMDSLARDSFELGIEYSGTGVRVI